MSTRLPFRKKEKNLLYLSVYDPHVPLTGAGVRGAEFVNNLARHFNLDLVYIDGSGQPPIPELSAKFSARLRGLRKKLCIDFSRFDYFIFSKSLYHHAHRLLAEQRYDFILCDYGLSAVYGLILSKRFRVPFVYCSHNVEYLGYLDKVKGDVRRLPFVPYVYWVEKAGVKKSRILVPITRSDAEYYCRWTNRDKMLIIPQGFDDSVFNPFYDPVENKPKIVLFCGNYNIQFNRDVVTTVMERILERVLIDCPTTKFRFIGANPPQGVKHPNVEFTGFVDDYPSHLKNADIVISPMKKGRGSPTKIIEALASGKKTIATPIGARSVEQDYENLSVCEIDEFPDIICSTLKSPYLSNQEDFEKLKSRYSWEENIKKLIDRIEHLCKR